jgi:hypothetical protein
MTDSADEGRLVAVEVAERLAAALDAVVARRRQGLDAGGELAERLQAWELVVREAEQQIAAIVAEAHRSGVWALDGHRSVRGWCQATVNWSYGETTQRIHTATLLGDCAEVDKALAAGEIGVAQVRELARARANPRCGSTIVDVENELVDAARRLPFDEFRVVVQGWEALADADGAHRDHDESHRNRSLSATTIGTGFALNARGGAAAGATITEILDAFTNSEFLADWDDARARLGDDADIKPCDLARTPAQRRFDAMVAIFVAAASTPPGSRPPEPVVDIVVDQATFEAAVAAMADGVDLDDVMPPPTAPTARRCQTIHGDPIDACDAVAAALVGQVRRVVYGADGCVIDLGVTSRLFRGASRLAVWLSSTRCIWPGCGRRHHNQIDHAQPWTAHGPTNPHNGAPLCGHHNRWKTRGYHTRRDPDGRWHTHRPDGTEIHPL